MSGKMKFVDTDSMNHKKPDDLEQLEKQQQYLANTLRALKSDNVKVLEKPSLLLYIGTMIVCYGSVIGFWLAAVHSFDFFGTLEGLHALLVSVICFGIYILSAKALASQSNQMLLYKLIQSELDKSQ